MDIPSQNYTNLLKTLEPNHSTTMVYATLQDELQMQKAKDLFLHPAKYHEFPENPNRTEIDCTVNFGIWPSHGRGHPSDPMPPLELEFQMLTPNQEGYTCSERTPNREETSIHVASEEKTIHSVDSTSPTPGNVTKVTQSHENQCEPESNESESEADSFHSCNDSMPEDEYEFIDKKSASKHPKTC